MLFATLGNITFQTTIAPESFESTRAYDYAEHKVVESQPLLQRTSDALEEISLDLMFHVSFTRPLAMLSLIVAAAEAHQAMPLIFGNGVHRGYFVITRLVETTRQMADDGSLICVALKADLKEYARDIEIDPNAPPIPPAPPPGVIVGPLTPGQSVAGVVNASGGASLNFPSANAGTSAVTSNSQPTGATSPLNPGEVPVASIWRFDSSTGGLLS